MHVKCTLEYCVFVLQIPRASLYRAAQTEGSKKGSEPRCRYALVLSFDLSVVTIWYTCEEEELPCVHMGAIIRVYSSANNVPALSYL